jgi:hypothetical protein
LFESIPWQTLVPDVENKIAVDGRGEFARNDYATTARTADGSLAISYLPTPRKLTIDLSQIRGDRAEAAWFNPRDGETSSIGEFKTDGRHVFEPAAEGDWVLLLKAK